MRISEKAKKTAIEMPLFDIPQARLVLQLLVKCADLGHTTAKRELHVKWSQLLEKEFFL